MRALTCLPVIVLTMALAACGVATPVATSAPAPGVGTPIVITAFAVSVGTVEPITAVPGQVIPTVVAPTPTPIPPLPGGGLGPTELKYRILAQFPEFFFCDPDYYPIARADEMELARQRFAEIQANTEEFSTILAHNNLGGAVTFTDDQKLLIYREHKRLTALHLELATGGYQFQIQVAKTEGQGERVTGLIDGQGTITIQQRETSFATCPICLAADTLIDTPYGPVPVQQLSVGMVVWSVDKAGTRVAMPLIKVGSTVVPAAHQVIHLTLSDGHELWASPGHPTTDGRTIGQLQAGDLLGGAVVLSAERVHYTGAATYDLLPAGDTGFYWANGILIASTLTSQP